MRGLLPLVVSFLLLAPVGQASASPVATAKKRPTRDEPHAPWTLDQWCSRVRTEVKKLGWKGLEPCTGIQWKIDAYSVLGKAIPTAEFGDAKATNTTLVISMVHGDENTPLYVVLKLARYLAEHEETLRRNSIRVVVAPLVNPDGFFRRTRTRTNAHKVDLNRNLPTRDWERDAHRLWKAKFKSNARRNPGPHAASEPETLFQMRLVRETRPQKILGMHAPLNVLDYDGPSQISLARFPKDYVRECVNLRNKLKARSTGFFPGSLGNYAGQEMGIPTITLELPSASPRWAEGYWKKFETGIRTMIDFQVPDLEVSRLREPSQGRKAALDQ